MRYNYKKHLHMMYKLKRKLQWAINIYHLLKARVACWYFGNPSHRLKVIGVTGTDGKTTTTHLIYHILQTCGYRVSMMSTVYARIGDTEYDTGLHMTTPDVWDVQKLLKKAADHGDEYFVMETTSHAFDQGRNWGIRYIVGAITNITHEHLDYHGTYSAYVRAKAHMIAQSRLTLLNRDDDSYNELLQYVHKTNTVKTYALHEKKVDYCESLGESLGIDLPQYNQYNYLLAYAVAIELGVERADILKALATFTLPKGRLEVAYSGDFVVIVDFAHTPHSIHQLLSYMRGKTTKRLIHVFGSAGLRDDAKRPIMGYNSAEFADVIILTEEDYRTEDPANIARQIGQGIEKNGMRGVSAADLNTNLRRGYVYIESRDEAISKAVAMAAAGDIILCTGKSHEKSLCRGEQEYDWDEFEAVKRAVAKRIAPPHKKSK